MTTPPDAKDKAARTYNAAADLYDDPSNTFWERFGRRTIARLDLRQGQRVLDVCCGSGASAIPAAEAVGPDGQVIGVDLAENLLALARAKASARGSATSSFAPGHARARRHPSMRSCACSACLRARHGRSSTGAVAPRAPRRRVVVTTWDPSGSSPPRQRSRTRCAKCGRTCAEASIPRDRISEPEAVRALLEQGDADAWSGAQGWPPPDSDARRLMAAVAWLRSRAPFDRLDAAASDQRPRPRVRASRPTVWPPGGRGGNVVYTLARKLTVVLILAAFLQFSLSGAPMKLRGQV